MKKTLLFIAAILMSVSVFAQTKTTFVSEHFDGSTMPAGWSIAGAGTSNWSISATQNAGGEANELHLAWSPQFNGTSRVVMPAVDLTGVTSVVVSFKHALNNYSGGHTLGIATSSDGGSTWNVGWQQSYSSSSAWSVSQTVTTADMGNSNVQFCLFYTGNSYNINDWYFDDIEIFSMENLDLALNSINMNATIGAGSTNIAFTVQNKGVETINQFKMMYQFDEDTPVEQTFDVTLASLATQQFTFTTPATLLPGSYDLTIGIVQVNGAGDDDPSNNSLTKVINVALGETQRIPMIEHFSSSTCGPCVNVNVTMGNLTNNNPGKFTYTKYQMNWPGNGDPYYTEEGGVRRQFYSVNAVPNVVLEGTNLGATSVSQAQLDGAYNTPSFADVRGSFNIDGNNITVKVDFMSFYDMTAEKAFVTVNEKVTTGNVGSNGETSFHHVFMKFLTSPSGNALDIPAGECQHFEWTQNMSSTHVEEMTDLEVSAWIQSVATHEVINSHFLYEYTDIHPYPVQNLVASYDAGTLTATWTAPEGGNALSYNVYVNGELAENVTALQYSAEVSSEFNVVAVEAVYENDMTSVKIVKTSGDTPVVCDPVTNLVAEPGENLGEYGANVSWTEPAGAISYKIYVDNEFLGSVESQPVFLSFIYDPFGTYTIGIVAVYDDCESPMTTVEFEWNGPSSVDETTAAATIYPNPTNGNIMISGNNISMVEVYNLCGQKVMSIEANANTVNVNMSALTTGVYMVKIVDGNGNATVNKVVKR